MAPTADPTRNNDSIDAADEVTPLLGAPTTGGPGNGAVKYLQSNGSTTAVDGSDDAQDEDKPMPYVQVLTLCYAAIAEPIVYFAIFPFISQMTRRSGNLKEEDVGFWTGTIESIFSVIQMVLMIFYGRLSERLGRKPVLVFSMFGVSVASALFGLSQTIWQMIMLRSIAGFFAGSAVTIRTMLSEHTTKLTQGRAFSWYMFSRNVGIFVGPLIGGALANPADQYPSVFGNSTFFKNYPYALPTFTTAAICMSGTLLCLFCLEETLVSKTDGSGKPEPTMTIGEILRAPGVGIILYVLGHIMFLSMAYTAVYPVFMDAKVEIGGLGLPPNQISYTLALGGLSQAFWILLVFPPVQKRIGTGNVLRICGLVWPIFMSMYPIVNEVFRRDARSLGWGILIPTITLSSGVAMSFAAVQLCINDVSPSVTVLSTVNAMSLSISSATRAVAPASFSSLFAIGVKINWAHGHLVWFVLIFLAVTSNIPLYLLPKFVDERPVKKTQNSQPDVNDTDGSSVTKPASADEDPTR